VYAALSAFLLVALPGRAQDAGNTTPPASGAPPASPNPPPPPATSSPQQPLPDQPTPSKTDTRDTNPSPKNDRLFGVLPNFTTVEGGTPVPALTARQKFKLSLEGSFDPAEFAFVGLVALVNQATNDNPQWGQGLKGYAERYGNAFASQAIGNVNTGAIWPALLHQDPRYYQLAKGSFAHRFFYSATRTLITHKDSGAHQFNYSEIFGSLTTAGISNLYQPRQERSLGDTMDTFSTQVLYDALSFEVKEFWPDIHRKLHKSK
jgi:hypothetical protein